MRAGLYKARDHADEIVRRFITTLMVARMARGWSPERLAVEAGVSPRAIRFWESGDRHPGMAEVLMLARALNFEINMSALRDVEEG